jgi:lipopolysaccharide export system ATP-binding protein
VSGEQKSKLNARGLRKSYKGRCVVDGINLEVVQGEVVGLLGPNGAGKTTSFNMIMGLTAADEGEVMLDSQPITSWPMYKRARAGIGYLSQEPSVFRRLSVRANLLLYLEEAGTRGEAGQERAGKVITEFDLGKVADSLASTLSGGERRRLEIARAMIQNPSFLLLDEPFSGIDPLAVEDIRVQIARLSQSGIGLLITDHNVRETLSSCDRAYIVKDGKIIEEGSPTEIASSERARALYLGDRFRLDQETGQETL